jgi:hypothetical protein
MATPANKNASAEIATSFNFAAATMFNAPFTSGVVETVSADPCGAVAATVVAASRPLGGGTLIKLASPAASAASAIPRPFLAATTRSFSTARWRRFCAAAGVIPIRDDSSSVERSR